MESVGTADKPMSGGADPTAAAGQAPESVAAPPGVMRIVSSGVEGALDRFSDPVLLAQGKVNVISVEAVQKRFGARWNMRKDQVYSFADRLLERNLAGVGLSLRVSETDFFIVHPDLGRLAGQAACLRYLREILNHFLGDAQMADAGVLQVTKFTNGRLEARQVDAAQADVVAAGGADPDAGAAASAGAGAAAKEPDKPAAVNIWTPFVCNDGRKLRVSATLEPVYELKGFTRIGFRMIRRVIDTRTEEELSPQLVALLSAADMLKVDMATITRGLDRLRAESGGQQQLSLIVPLSFSSLSSQRGRTELIAPLKEAGGLVKLGVICEICDIEGVPPGALLAAASLVRPFSLLVVGRLSTPAPNVVNRLRESGLQALSFECPPGMGDAEFAGWATAAIRAAKTVAKSVLVYRASTPARGGTLATLGASHMSLAPSAD